MRDALSLFAGFAATYLGFACLALAQRRHWQTVTGAADCSRAGRRALTITGVAALATGLAVILWSEGPDYGALLWVTQLAVAASCVVATLSWRPRLLKPLAGIPARA